MAHLVLRPFLDSYLGGHETASPRADASEEFDEERFLRRLPARRFKQWALPAPASLASEESVSAEMFRTALKLARHRGLVTSERPVPRQTAKGLPADELREVRTRSIAEIADIARREVTD